MYIITARCLKGEIFAGRSLIRVKWVVRLELWSNFYNTCGSGIAVAISCRRQSRYANKGILYYIYDTCNVSCKTISVYEHKIHIWFENRENTYMFYIRYLAICDFAPARGYSGFSPGRVTRPRRLVPPSACRAFKITTNAFSHACLNAYWFCTSALSVRRQRRHRRRERATRGCYWHFTCVTYYTSVICVTLYGPSGEPWTRERSEHFLISTVLYDFYRIVRGEKKRVPPSGPDGGREMRKNRRPLTTTVRNNAFSRNNPFLEKVRRNCGNV